MDPTQVFQYGSGNVRGRQKNLDENEETESEEEDDESFLPTVRVLDEVRSSVGNLEIERMKLKLSFIDPPKQEIYHLKNITDF